MATREGLVRSFYTWLRKVESSLKGRVDVLSGLPKTRPTLISEMPSFSANVCLSLSSTAYAEKATYWASLFEKIEREGWVEGEKIVATDNVEAH